MWRKGWYGPAIASWVQAVDHLYLIVAADYYANQARGSPPPNLRPTSSSCLLHLPATLPLTLASPSTSLHQTATVDALLEAWGRRSGKRLLRYEWLHNTTNAHASQAAHANSHRHPKLEDDVTDLADRAALSELYRGSNQQVYRLIREDARLTVLPNGPASGAYDGAFLDAVWDREGR